MNAAIKPLPSSTRFFYTDHFHSSLSNLDMAANPPPPLSEQVRHCVDHYLAQQESVEGQDLYRIILEAVEGPILESVLSHTQGNASKAARIMGIGRSTLIKKIKHYKEKGYLKSL